MQTTAFVATIFDGKPTSITQRSLGQMRNAPTLTVRCLRPFDADPKDGNAPKAAPGVA